jgi:hypothetical protein
MTSLSLRSRRTRNELLGCGDSGNGVAGIVGWEFTRLMGQPCLSSATLEIPPIVLRVLSASYRLASRSEGRYDFLPMSGTLRLALSLALIASGIGAIPDSRSEDISDHRSQLMRIVERGLEDLSGT